MIKLKLVFTDLDNIDMISHYVAQLDEILSPYVNIDITFVYDGDIIDKVTLEDDDDIYEKSIFLALDDAYKYDWIHLQLTEKDWRKLGIRRSLWGQHRSVYGKAITYGRWNEKARRKMQDRYEHEYPDIYEAVVGMIHEFGHSKEGNMALVHSIMYGYDRIYTKEEEKRLKPKRFMKQCSIKKLLELIFGQPVEPTPEPTPEPEHRYRYFQPYEITGLKHELVKLLDEARHIAGIPFVINSGYRTAEHNKAVGGVPNSAHVKGLAVDIRAIDGKQAYNIIKSAQEVGIRRIGLNRKENFVHLDIDYTKPNPTIYTY